MLKMRATCNILLRLCVPVGWFGIALVYGCGARPRVTQASVQAIVDSLIPVGSVPQRALRVLDSLKVQHSDYGKQRSISANFGKSHDDGIVTGAVYVTLTYDSTDHLATRTVKELFTGP